jgi:hypothetical protein
MKKKGFGLLDSGFVKKRAEAGSRHKEAKSNIPLSAPYAKSGKVKEGTPLS